MTLKTGQKITGKKANGTVLQVYKALANGTLIKVQKTETGRVYFIVLHEATVVNVYRFMSNKMYAASKTETETIISHFNAGRI